MGRSSQALARHVSKVSQALAGSLEQLTEEIDQTASALSKRAGWDSPPLRLVRQRGYIDLVVCP
uniref:Uncharacterized protein n=1 Tax=Candidatus Kentrum eta TaxID=2126337 RepID=A0A450VJT3_9GAMM|nr:MAG: hypothetical protein BECKH772B_GA0070898_104942 [Candidatus Kentron sp. H]VFK04990.1 MAG: hypothetical protein BECKH772A_GA0070896_104882 [Candidatus Kentron sp. H]VFK08082.1 MAG: hypothetical protein BECKH772C_GA0070978_104852 [Candidatus Kentron sp. H]